MAQPSNVPRRAWQRRNLGAKRAAAKRSDETDSSFASSSDSESDDSEEYESPRRPPIASRAVRPRMQHISVDVLSDESDFSCPSDSDCDSGFDSGYHSLEEDPDDKAEYYDELLERFQTEGPTLANHGDNTKQQDQEEKWNKFCKYRKLDPIEALRQCEVPLFKLYLVWRVENSRIKKESSVMTYWKVLSMVYSQKIASWMTEEVLYDWILTYVTPTYGLDTSKKEKAGIFVKDLAVLLNHHWIRDEEVFAHERLRLRYEHLEFQLFPPLSGDERPRIVLKVNLEHIKRSGGQSEPKQFAFREDDMLIYDPLIPIMALAFVDHAFQNEFVGPEDIYKLVVPANSDRLCIHWKDQWRKRPVFRDVEDSEHGLQVALDKARVANQSTHGRPSWAASTFRGS
ncbi:hypothetical protein QBC46DRAFT_342346 [Diplogelasinospora grovesii]|uniref:Uncharacterized protein n=1 Tax=Diplogelasinospora grovesii TaxID=303347 RepID=A0AAN6S4K9_9PEZI|nr:hypothetical protein QBC46DRAFT_342346 [Diplogelasinospora grovesii]